MTIEKIKNKIANGLEITEAQFGRLMKSLPVDVVAFHVKNDYDDEGNLVSRRYNFARPGTTGRLPADHCWVRAD